MIKSSFFNFFIIINQLFILIVLFGQISWTLRAFEGPCPSNMTAIGDLDMDRFLGKWYTYSMYPRLSNRLPKCQSTEFIKLENDTIVVKTREVSSKSGTLKIRIATINNIERSSGKYDLLTNNKALPDGVEMYVLDTDYKNFAIRFMCIDSNNIFNFQWAAIQTRRRMPSAKTIFIAQSLARHSGIILSKMGKVSQDACPPDS